MLRGETGWHRAIPVVALEQKHFEFAHISGLLGLSVVVAEHVEHAMHDEEREFIVEGSGVLGELPTRNGRTHDDIAEQARRPVG